MRKITLLLAFIATFSLNAQVTSGVIPLSSNYTAQIDIDDTNVVVTMIGPEDLWLGLGFGVNSMTVDGDVITFDSSGFNDRRFIGVGAMPPTDTQDWTEVSNTTAGGVRTLVVTRTLAGSDATDYTFDPDEANLLLVWARGNGTLNFGNHGGANRDDTSTGFTLGLVDQDISDSIQVYPNPSTDVVTINFDNQNASGTELNIYAANGQLVRTQTIAAQQTSLDISTLNAGVYILDVRSENGIGVKRLVKL